MDEFFFAKNIQKTFGEMEISASISCQKGEILGVVGASGSGKSTILRIIAGLEKNDSQNASIFLDGKEIGNLPSGKREIGMVFQGGALFDNLRVVDNVAYGLVSRGEKKKVAREKASAFLKRFGLEGFEKRFPDTLSGGEAQRVSLARTLILRPKIVLFDEPLSALDAPLRKKLAVEILALKNEFGFSGILVTHDIEEARFLCSRVLLMKNGKIAWEGNASDFGIEKYET